MEKIIFIGAGAVASEVLSYMEDIEKQFPQEHFEILGFLDDSFDNYTINSEKYNFDLPFLGTIKEHFFSADLKYIFGFGDPFSKRNIIQKLDIHQLTFPNIIHPSAIVSKSSKIGFGNVIYPNTVIGPNVQIGNFNLLTSYSFISHDCKIGDFNFFSTAGLAGNVKVGNNNFFGIRSTIIPSINLGSNNLIQAGMVIDKDVADNETVFYRYKEKISIIKSN